jgi:S-adenosylmethionine-dependent methyltransferase
VPQDAWAALADPFAEAASASVKGQVRTFVLHSQLLRHLPAPPATVLDIGGGAAHQSLPLARLGYDVTVLDPSPGMLAKARQRLAAEPDDVRRRVRLVEAAGERAEEATDEQQFAAVLCHGVLMYLAQPEPLLAAACRCASPGGVVSIMTLNARTLAVRPALEHRWTDALAAFDATGEVGVLGTDTRGDTVENLSDLMRRHQVRPEAWYGVWLFSDWMDPSPESTDVTALASVEFQASLRDPYRQLSRAFHLIGRKAPRMLGHPPTSARAEDHVDQNGGGSRSRSSTSTGPGGSGGGDAPDGAAQGGSGP